MKEKKSFLFYYDWEGLLKPMTKEQVGELLFAILDYNKNGVIPEFDDKLLSGVFSFMQSRFDDDNKRYEKVCKQNAEYAKKRWEKERKKAELENDEKKAESNRPDVDERVKASQNYIPNISPGFPPVCRIDE